MIKGEDKPLISKRIVLRFSSNLVEQPIVSGLVKGYNLEVNILKANINPAEEGFLVLELKGPKEGYNAGLEYLKNIGVHVEPLSKDIVRREKRCTHCGVCISICPTEALKIDPVTYQIHFYDKKCIVCEACILTCPPRAMEVHF
jgi:ferredoxin